MGFPFLSYLSGWGRVKSLSSFDQKDVSGSYPAKGVSRAFHAERRIIQHKETRAVIHFCSLVGLNFVFNRSSCFSEATRSQCRSKVHCWTRPLVWTAVKSTAFTKLLLPRTSEAGWHHPNASCTVVSSKHLSTSGSSASNKRWHPAPVSSASGGISNGSNEWIQHNHWIYGTQIHVYV